MVKICPFALGFSNSKDANCVIHTVWGRVRAGREGGAEDEIVSSMDSMGMNLNKLREIVQDRWAWCAAVHGVTEWDTTYGLNNKDRQTDLNHSAVHLKLTQCCKPTIGQL